MLPVTIQQPFWTSVPGFMLYILLFIAYGYGIALFFNRKILQKQVQELTQVKINLEKANTKLQ